MKKIASKLCCKKCFKEVFTFKKRLKGWINFRDRNLKMSVSKDRFDL